VCVSSNFKRSSSFFKLKSKKIVLSFCEYANVMHIFPVAELLYGVVRLVFLSIFSKRYSLDLFF